MNREKRFLARIFVLVLVGWTSLGFFSCREQAAPGKKQVGIEQTQAVNIPAQKAYEIIQKEKSDTNFVILDVRTEQEFRQGHIQGAVNLNFYDPNFKAQLAKLDTNKTYLVYCRSGHRSGLAVEIMKKLHFKHLYNLQGGMIQWRAQKLPVVPPEAGKK